MPWDSGDDEEEDPANYFKLPNLPGLKTLAPASGVPEQPASKYRPEVERMRPWALDQTGSPEEAEQWLAGADQELTQQEQNKARIRASDAATSEGELQAQGDLNAGRSVLPVRDAANQARIAANQQADTEAAAEAGRHSNSPLALAGNAIAAVEKATEIPKVTPFIREHVIPGAASALDTGLNAAAKVTPVLKGLPIVGPLAQLNERASPEQRQAVSNTLASQIPSTGLDIASSLPIAEAAGGVKTGARIAGDLAARAGETTAARVAREALAGGEEGSFNIARVGPGGLTRAEADAVRNKALSAPGVTPSGVKLREAAPVSEEMQVLGDNLQLDPASVGIASKEDIAAQIAKLRANPKGKTAELGRLEAQQEALGVMEGHDAPAAFNIIGDTYSSLHGSTPQLRAKIDELGRIHNSLLDAEDVNRWAPEALKDAPAGASFHDITHEIQMPGHNNPDLQLAPQTVPATATASAPMLPGTEGATGEGFRQPPPVLGSMKSDEEIFRGEQGGLQAGLPGTAQEQAARYQPGLGENAARGPQEAAQAVSEVPPVSAVAESLGKPASDVHELEDLLRQRATAPSPELDQRIVELGRKTPYDTAEIISARAQQNMMAPTAYNQSPARIAKREEWGRQLESQGGLANPKPGDVVPIQRNRVAEIVLGPPASGKSSSRAEVMRKSLGAMLIDSDEAKQLIPEFGGGRFAGAVHLESDMIAGSIFDRSMGQGDNMVLPLVGKNQDKIEELGRLLKENGYDVRLTMVDVPEKQAAQRAVERFEGSGRFVDPDYVLNKIDSLPRETFENLKGQDWVTGYERISNDVPRGQSPVTLESTLERPAAAPGDLGPGVNDAGHPDSGGPATPEAGANGSAEPTPIRPQPGDTPGLADSLTPEGQAAIQARREASRGTASIERPQEPAASQGPRVTQSDGSSVEATPEAIQGGVRRVLQRTPGPPIEVDPSNPAKLVEDIIDAVAAARTRGGRPLFEGVPRGDIEDAVHAMADQLEVTPGHTGPGARHPQMRVTVKTTTKDAIEQAQAEFRAGPEGEAHAVEDVPTTEVGGGNSSPPGGSEPPSAPTPDNVPPDAAADWARLQRGNGVRGVDRPVSISASADRNATQARGLIDAGPAPALGPGPDTEMPGMRPPSGTSGGEPPQTPRSAKQGGFGGDWTPKSGKSVFEHAKDALYELALVLPRAMGTAFDYSYPFRQAGLLIRNLKDFGPNFVHGLHALASEDFAVARQRAIEGARYNPRTLDLTSFAKDAKYTQREEEFMSRLTNWIPGLKQSGRAATVFINGLRSDMANRVAESWIRNQGVRNLKEMGELEGGAQKVAEFTKNLDTYGNYLNRATGRGNLGNFENSVGALNQVFYGARRNVAMVQVPGYLFNRSAAVRKEAMLDMVGFFGTGMATLGVAHLAGADVGLDPSAADFGKIKVGDTRVDIWGGYQQMARVIYKIGAGQIRDPGNSTETANAVLGFLRNKLSPQAGIVTNIAKGKNAIGQRVSAKDIPAQFVPLGIQGLVQAIQHDGAVGGLMGATGLLGTGTQSYESIGDVRDKASQKLGLGQSYKDLTPANQSRVNAQDAVTSFVDKNPTDYSDAKKAALDPIDQKQADAESAFKSGDLTKPITDIWHDIGIEKRAKQEQLTADYLKSFTGNANQFRKDVNSYFDQKSTNTDSTINFEETTAKQDAFLKTLPPSRQSAIADFLQVSRDNQTPLRKAYLDYIAKKDAAGYFKADLSAGERAALDRANPELDALSAYFSSGQQDKKPNALQSASAVKLALERDPSKQYHLAGMSRAVNETPGTQQAFDTYGKRASDFVSGALVERQGDTYAAQLFGKKYDKLTTSQQATVASKVRSAALATAPDLEAYLAWMGQRETVSPAAEVYLQQLRAKYGHEQLDKPLRLAQ